VNLWRRLPYSAGGKPPARRRKTMLLTTATGETRLVPAVLDIAMSVRAISAAILFVVTLAAYELVMNEMFYIYNPAVVGNQRVPASEIVAASQIETLHVLWLQPDRAALSLLQRMPELQTAYVGCALPAECTIQVAERAPLFEWKQSQTRTWIDAEGIAFPARGQTPAILVIEVAPDVPALLPGKTVSRDLMTTVTELIRVLPEVKTFRFTTVRGIEFTDPQNHWTVYVGVGSDIAARVSMWKAVSANLAARNVRAKFVDVRYPQAPFYGK